MAIEIIIREHGEDTWSTLNHLTAENTAVSEATGSKRDASYRDLWNRAVSMASRWRQTAYPDAEIRVVDTTADDPRKQNLPRKQKAKASLLADNTSIHAKVIPTGFAALAEVPNGTGFNRVRDLEAGWFWLSGSYPDRAPQWFGPYPQSQFD